MIYGGIVIKINSRLIIVCLLILMAMTVSASFASEDVDSIQTSDDIGLEPISVSEESMDDSSQANESLSAGVVVEGEKLDSADSSSEILNDNDAGTFTELNETINNNSNNRIDLYKDYNGSDYYDGIVINRELTIDGHGHVLDAANFGCIFTVKTTSKIVLVNLTLKQATQTAITFEKEATVDFINCTFIENQRESRSGNSDSYGGAIRFKSNLVNSNFINTTFIQNGIFTWNDYSNAMGGAICVEGNANNNRFENTVFDRNFVRFQGNVITDTTFKDFGAGIAFLGTTSNNEFVNTTFTGNFNQPEMYFTSEYITPTPKQYGRGQGAGIHFGGISTNTSFVACLFEKNSASAGGAIHFDAKSENILFENSRFIGNDVKHGDTEYNYVANPIQNEGEGGALRFTNGVNVLFNNTIFDSNAGRYGGSIFIKAGNNLTFTNVNFTNNQATSRAYTMFHGNQVVNPKGGAIHIQGVNDISFDHIIFEGNNAFVDSPSDAYYNRFTNIRGGAVSIDSATNLVMNNTVFINNYAKNIAGAMYLSGISNSVFTNLNFTGNHLETDAKASGGAIYASATAENFNLTNINLIDNGIIFTFKDVGSSYIARSIYGGVAYLAGSNIGLYNVNITNNTIYTPSGPLKSGDVCMGMVHLTGSNLTFDGVNFTGNDINVPVNDNVGGSAISASNAVNGVAVRNVLFENNTSVGKGAVYILGKSNFIFNNTKFIRNNGTEGAAIHASADNVTIVNSIFENNTATKTGSAIYLSGSNHNLYDLNITGNRLCSNGATALGGALSLNNLKNSEIRDINIIGNKDDATSAEVAAIYANKISDVKFDNVMVINNTGYKSAVILFKTPSNVTICNSNFTGNALASTSMTSVISTDDVISVDNCVFKDNLVNNAEIYLKASMVQDSYLRVSSCVFYNPFGKYYIYAQYRQVNISDIDFHDFTGVNAIYLYTSGGVISDCNFTNINCSNSAVYCYDYNGNHILNLTHVNFINNTGSSQGGAIYVYGSGLNIHDAYFENNTAFSNGGSIYVVGSRSKVNIDQVTIKGSTAGRGGAISSSYIGEFKLSNSTIENCQADYEGGAVFIDYIYNDKYVYNVTFTNNTAGITGGAIHINSGNLDIVKSTFTNNTAAETGGAIHSGWAALNIDGCNFTKNNASAGSAIETQGTLTVSNSIFLKNKANSTELIVEFNRDTDETTCYYSVADNYINAIHATADATFSNVTYFEYEGNTIFNTDDKPAVNNYSKANQTFTIQFFDKNDTLLQTIVKNSDLNGNLNLIGAPVGKHHVVISRMDDDYYTAIQGKAICVLGDFAILQNLINALDDNGVLSLNRTYVYTIGADNITEGIVINKTNITIEGNGYSINALFMSRIFQVLTNDVKFHNVNFANASGLEGAFIFGVDVNNTDIINCSFENTFPYQVDEMVVNPYGSYYPESPDPSDLGAGVLIMGNNLNVANSNFTSIMALYGASVYFTGENATFINSRFNATRAGYGGALFLDAVNVLIDTCDFNNTGGALAGGAIVASGKNYVIVDSNFTNCGLVSDDIGGVSDIDALVYSLLRDENDPNNPYAGFYIAGGAICSQASNVNITKSSFDACYAQSFGGAIFADGKNTSMTDLTFDSCRAASGGAVFVCINGMNSSVEDCSFENNSAFMNGGAVSWYGENGTLRDSTFDKNYQYHFDLYSNQEINGGGAVFWGGMRGSIDNCNFTDNTVCIPAGDFLDQITQDIISWGGNPSYVIYDILYQLGYDFSNGGAVLIRGHYINITNSNFKDNFAQSGGAIAVSAPNVQVLSRDYMPTDIPWDEYLTSNIDIRNCDFKDNFAQYGGALFINGYKVNIEDVNFTNNTALMAGAVRFEGINCTISNAIFEDNYAFIAGAFISGRDEYGEMSGFDNMIDNSTFINNGANGAGAVLWLDEGGILNDSHFIGNRIVDVHDHYAPRFAAAYSIALNDTMFMILQDVPSDLSGVPDIQMFMDSAGAVGWCGHYGLINYCDFTQSNATYGGALIWQGSEGIVNNSEFSKNTAVVANAIGWAGDYGTVDNTVIMDNNGYTLGGGEEQITKSVVFHSLTEHRSEYYMSYYDYDRIALEKYEEMLPELQQLYGDDVTLVGSYYDKVESDSSSYSYRYYNVTFHYILLTTSSSGWGPDLSRSNGAVYWVGQTGTINNTAIANNRNTIGGGLYAQGDNLLVANSNFTNNSAFYGGAAFWEGYDGTVYNSIFKDNYGFEDKGNIHILNYTELTYDYSYIFNGSSWKISNDIGLYGGLENATNDIFNNCDVYDLQYRGCAFNYTDNGDGTYTVDVIYSFRVTESVETSEYSPELGGAIYWEGDYANIVESQFINNSAFEGAAVYLPGYYAQIINSTFKNNVAHDYTRVEVVDKQKYVGYDIYTESYGYPIEFNSDYFVASNFTEVVQNVTKLYNSDTIRYEGYSFEFFDLEDPDLYGPTRFKIKATLVFSLIDYELVPLHTASRGAAVFIEGEETVINQSSFIENSASLGGAVYVNGERTVIDNSTFKDNKVYNSSTEAVSNEIETLVEKVEYYREYSTGVGPKYGLSDAHKFMLDVYDKYDADEIRVSYTIDGYYFGGDWIGYYLNKVIYNISLINYANSSRIGSFGGAVYVNATPTLINASTFTSNNAEHGGAVYVAAENIMLSEDTFNLNTAEYGGALYTDAIGTVVDASTFELNHAYLGGAAYWNGQDGTVARSNFFNNTAFNAGAIYYKGNNCRIEDNSIFKYNKADAGSALYVEGTGLSVISSTLLENQAKAASIYYTSNLSDDNVLTIHAIFIGNDNFINAMYIQNDVYLEDVTYCPLDNNGNPRVTTFEDGIKINVKLSDSDSVLRTYSNFTNIDGETVIVVPHLHYGRYILTVDHEEDNYYTHITETEVFFVDHSNTPMKLVVDDIFYRENATIELHIESEIVGDFIINVDGNDYPVSINGFVAKIEVPDLEGGIHNVTASFAGNGIFSANSTKTTFLVKPIPTTIVVESENVTHRDDVPINITLGDANVSGSVLVIIEGVRGTSLEITDSNKISAVIGTLDAGVYNITAFYTGDHNYLNATNRTSITVNPAKINAQVIAHDAETDEESKFVIIIPSDFVGKVNITVDGISKTFNVSGSNVIAFEKLSAGNKTANLSFYGNKNYIDETVSANFTVTEVQVIYDVFSIHSFNMTRAANSPYDYQAEFLNSNGEVLANAPVAFKVNGVVYNAMTNKDGIAQLTTSHLAPGKYDVVSMNLATGEEETMKLTIVARIYGNKDMTMDFRDGSSFVVRVVGDDGKVAPEGEIVSITANGVSYVAKVGKNGYARLLINLNPKKYTVVSEYKGFKTTNTLVVKQTLKLVKKTVKVKKGKKLVLKAKLKWSSGKPIKGKVIKFKFKGKFYSAKTNKKGIAKVTIKKKVTKKLKKGKKYNYSARYYTNIVKGSVKVKK